MDYNIITFKYTLPNEKDKYLRLMNWVKDLHLDYDTETEPIDRDQWETKVYILTVKI